MTWRGAPAVAVALILLSAAACGPRIVSAQAPPGEHAQHHPAGAPPGPLMPLLMDADRLSETERAALREAAEQHVTRGLTLIEEGSRELSRARGLGDETGLERAAQRLGEGLALWETGVAARRALSLPPADARYAALRWFKGQMNLGGTPGSPRAGAPWGISWAHLGAMAFLTALVLAGVVLYLYKVRRALATLDRLTADNTSP